MSKIYVLYVFVCTCVCTYVHVCVHMCMCIHIIPLICRVWIIHSKLKIVVVQSAVKSQVTYDDHTDRETNSNTIRNPLHLMGIPLFWIAMQASTNHDNTFKVNNSNMGYSQLYKMFCTSTLYFLKTQKRIR